MISVLVWVLVGLVAGWLAAQIMGPGGYGMIGDIVVGLIGALIGGLLASWLGLGGLDKLEPFTFGNFIITVLVALVGAIIFIAILRALTGRRA